VVEHTSETGGQYQQSAAPVRSARDERRLVEIRGYVIRLSREVVDVKVLDLSYDGCAIATLVPLIPGEKVKLSVLGRGATAASVRWCKGRTAGLLFQSEPVSKERWPRNAERVGIEAEASLRREGRLSYRVTLFDVTRFGCRSEFVERPRIHERVWMKFNGLEAIEAVVCWIEESTTGLMYKNPIHPAVFELLLRRLRPDTQLDY
jgi:hypothetical protein